MMKAYRDPRCMGTAFTATDDSFWPDPDRRVGVIHRRRIGYQRTCRGRSSATRISISVIGFQTAVGCARGVILEL
jgi:hypothetical protein